MTIQRFQNAYDDRGPLQTLRRKELELLCRCFNVQWQPGMKATDMRQLLQINNVNPENPQVQQKYRTFVSSLEFSKGETAALQADQENEATAQDAKPNGNTITDGSQDTSGADDVVAVPQSERDSADKQQAKHYPQKVQGSGKEFQARPSETLTDIPVDDLSYLEMKTLLSNHGIPYQKTDKKNKLRQRVAEAHVNGDFA